MVDVGLRELLEAGVHFGHQTRRWNPKMRRFIYGERGGIYLIDLVKTQALIEQAQRFAAALANRGGTVLFVGTKKQARDGIKDVAEAAGMPYVNHRWLGGLLTNYQTISLRIKRLHDLERYANEGQLALLPTRERMAAESDLEKLQANLGGVKHMQRVPDAMFVIDLKTEAIAVREAQRLRIPIIGLVDTNCDPDGIDYVIPGNDDAIRACNLAAHAIGDVVAEGRARFRAEEEQARREAEEQARREAEERARREAEEQERREAEEAARAAVLTHGGEGEPRDVAEAAVAEAVEHGARRQAEGRRAAEAGAVAQAADEPAMPAAGNVGPGRREAIHDPNVGDRVPQEAAARAGEGAPASDTAEESPAVEDEEQRPARRARQRARRTRQAAEQVPAPEPGPSPVAAAAEAEAPPAPEPGPAAAEAEAPPGEVSEPAPAPEAPTEPPTPPPAPEAEVPPEPGPAEAAVDTPVEPPTTAPEQSPEQQSAVDRAQAAANQAVDAAQDAAEGAARVAEGAAEAIADRTPGPLKGVADAAAGAAGALADAVADQPDTAEPDTDSGTAGSEDQSQ
jgi:small subunit ribosomal protein S2